MPGLEIPRKTAARADASGNKFPGRSVRSIRNQNLPPPSPPSPARLAGRTGAGTLPPRQILIVDPDSLSRLFFVTSSGDIPVALEFGLCWHGNMYSRKIYATGSATANGVATVTIPANSRLISIDWALDINSITDNAELVAELSAASATEVGVNEAQQCLGEVRVFGNFVTSGLAQVGVNKQTHIPAVPFAAGQKIYLHVVVTGTLTYQGGAVLWFA